MDTVFSRFIRLKHKRCQKCGRLGHGDEQIFGLEASHYFSRRKWSTRFDESNVDCLCKVCHKEFHKYPSEYERWKEDQLGERDFELLTLRANGRSQMGSKFWKGLTKKQAEKIFYLS